MYKHIYIYLSTMWCFKILWGLSEKSPVIINIMRTVYAPWCNLEAKESGLECACVNNDAFTVLVKGGGNSMEWACVLCGCFIQNDSVEQWICIKFCVELEHSSVETIGMIQKPAAMGNWWLATSSWQHACSCITSHAELFGETSSQLGASAPYGSDLVPYDFWLFSKLKSPLKGKRFQTVDEIQQNTRGCWWRLENCVRSQGAYFEGD